MNGCLRAGDRMTQLASHCVTLASNRGAPIARVTMKVIVMHSRKPG